MKLRSEETGLLGFNSRSPLVQALYFVGFVLVLYTPGIIYQAIIGWKGGVDAIGATLISPIWWFVAAFAVFCTGAVMYFLLWILSGAPVEESNSIGPFS